MRFPIWIILILSSLICLSLLGLALAQTGEEDDDDFADDDDVDDDDDKDDDDDNDTSDEEDVEVDDLAATHHESDDIGGCGY